MNRLVVIRVEGRPEGRVGCLMVPAVSQVEDIIFFVLTPERTECLLYYHEEEGAGDHYKVSLREGERTLAIEFFDGQTRRYRCLYMAPVGVDQVVVQLTDRPWIQTKANRGQEYSREREEVMR